MPAPPIDPTAFEPAAREMVNIIVCRGLSCSDAFSADVLKDYEKALGTREGGRTPEGICLKTQHCFGRCAIGPNVRVKKGGLEKDFACQTPGQSRAVVDLARSLI